MRQKRSVFLSVTIVGKVCSNITQTQIFTKKTWFIQTNNVEKWKSHITNLHSWFICYHCSLKSKVEASTSGVSQQRLKEGKYIFKRAGSNHNDLLCLNIRVNVLNNALALSWQRFKRLHGSSYIKIILFIVYLLKKGGIELCISELFFETCLVFSCGFVTFRRFWNLRSWLIEQLNNMTY